jgi:tRNA pseudouridine synthase 10
MINASHGYDFSTVIVGAMIKPSILDRDDYIRSKFKLRGRDSVKTDITKELGKQFIKKTKKSIDFLNPDLTFTIDFKNSVCDLRSKSIILQARYTKSKRGLPQKQKPCVNCFGKGCRNCNFHGISEYDSIEGKISKFLFNNFGGTIAKYTWIGGEDQSSLVVGSGRPFFVKIQNPLKRHVSLLRKIKLDDVTIHDCKIIFESPKTPLKFTSSIKITVLTENEVSSLVLQKLNEIVNVPVVIYDSFGKRTEKIISQLKYKKNGKNCFILFIEAEGGLPVKRFVESSDVIPGITQILKNKCRCVQFDFLDIILK